MAEKIGLMQIVTVLLMMVIALSIGFYLGNKHTKDYVKEPGLIVDPDTEMSFQEEYIEVVKPEVEESAINTPAASIIKEYNPGDVAVLKERALELVKKSDCYKQVYELELSEDEKIYSQFYSTTKVINLVYDYNERFHGWIVFKLVRINRELERESLKVNIDLTDNSVTCNSIDLLYTSN